MIPVPENVTNVSMGVHARLGAGAQLLRCLPLSPAKACPMAAWAGECVGKGLLSCWPWGPGNSSAALGSGLPEAHGHAGACSMWTGRGKEGGHALVLCWRQGLTCWASPHRGDYRMEGVWVYFHPVTWGPQTRKRRWPCGQELRGIKVPSEPVQLQGKESEGQEGETKCMETPPGSQRLGDEKCSVMFAILLTFPPPPQHAQYFVKLLWDCEVSDELCFKHISLPWLWPVIWHLDLTNSFD